MLLHALLLVAPLLLCPAFGLFAPPHGLYPIDRSLARRLSGGAEYTDLAGVIGSSPRCLSRDEEHVHCFYTTPDGTAGYASVKDGTATYSVFGGTVKGDPRIVGYGSSGVFAFYLTVDKQLAVAAVETETDYDETTTVLDFGTFLEPPGCVLLEYDSEIFCVVRSTNGGMYIFKYTHDAWQTPIYVTDNPTTSVDCVLNTIVGRIHCWSTNRDHVLAERLFTDTGLPDSPIWVSLDNQARGRVSVYMLGVIPLPRARSYRTNRMVDIFGNFDGNLMSDPDCANSDSRSLDCFALDEDGGIQRNYQLMGFLYVRRTSGWVHYGGSFVGTPSCLFLKSDRHFHCYMKSTDGTLVEGRFKPGDTPRMIAT